MSKKSTHAISPTRAEDYPQWYQQIIIAADLAENSPVRGCMIIKPWGCKLWENIQQELNFRFEETGHQNAYFPIFIPLRFFEKEAEHVEGFAKECAVVTHHRLEPDGKGGLKPAGKLEEPLVVRPTSETIIGDAFSRWVNSYRDLPILMNQWANVVRWEMRPRLFLRTSEFLWQEGHTVHASQEEAKEETQKMHLVYRNFAHEILAIPVVHGEKSEAERFPGAVNTYTIEAMMQDGKALQAGTSHFLGQNFSKAQDIKFQNVDNQEEFAWTTSWGVSTRLIGGLIMAHSDDDGLRLPPKVSPLHAVLLPVIPKPENQESVMSYIKEIEQDLKKLTYNGKSLRVQIDTRDLRGGEKNWSWIKKGVPLRLEIGPRDAQENKVCVMRRDQAHKQKDFITQEDLKSQITTLLDEIQENLFSQAKDFQEKHTKNINSLSEFEDFFEKPGPDGIAGGFAQVHWCGSPQCETKLSENHKTTIRCIPSEPSDDQGNCIQCQKPSLGRVLLARSY